MEPQTEAPPAEAPPIEPAPVFYVCACGNVLGRVSLGALEFIAEDGGIVYLLAGRRVCPVCGKVKLWECRGEYRERKANYREQRARGAR